MNSRHRCCVLAVVGCLLLAGCGGSPDTLTGEASPATVGDETLSAAGWERVTETERRLSTTVTVTLQGDSELTSRRDVNATTHLAVYRETAESPAVLAVWSVPALTPLEGTDVTVNPVRRRSTDNLTRSVQSTYAELDSGTAGENVSMRLLGTDRGFAVVAGTATGPGGDSVAVTVVTATVEHEGDFVVVVGIVPEDRDPVDTLASLVGDVRH